MIDGSLGKRRQRPVWRRARAGREFDHGRHCEVGLLVGRLLFYSKVTWRAECWKLVV